MRYRNWGIKNVFFLLLFAVLMRSGFGQARDSGRVGSGGESGRARGDIGRSDVGRSVDGGGREGGESGRRDVQMRDRGKVEDAAGLVRAFRFVDSVFGRSEFTYDVAGPDIPKDVRGILARFDSAVNADKGWFAEYRKKFGASGQPLPYSERMGISAEEYRRLQELEKQPPRLVTMDQKRVGVFRQGNVLRFGGKGNEEGGKGNGNGKKGYGERGNGETGEGGARIFGYLVIDLQQQRMVFAGDTLPYKGVMNAEQLASFYLTQGYSWRLEKVDLKSTLQNDKVTARVVEIDMGLPGEGGRVFLRIKYQDMKEGVSQADLDLTGFVH